MTPERQKALEAVAKAARAWWQEGASPSVQHARAVAVIQALHALDALPADPAPAGGVMEVAVWASPYGELRLVRAGACDDKQEAWARTRLGTVRLPLTEGGV